MGERPVTRKNHGKLAQLSLIWLKHYLSESADTFLNATASAIRAGYKAKCNHTFQQIGFKNRVKYGPKIAEWLDEHGFSEARLKTKVLELMEAKETAFQKVRGAVLQSSLPEGHRVVAISGTVITTKNGGAVYGDGDSLLEIDVQNYGVQVKSLEMALKVKGLFAPERREHSGTVSTTLQLTDEDRILLRQAIDTSIKKLMEANHAKPA